MLPLSYRWLGVIEPQLFRRRFIMYVQPLDGQLGPNALSVPAGNAENGGTIFQGAAPAAGDNISRFVPPGYNQGTLAAPYNDGYGNSGSIQTLFGPLMGMLQQLMQALQSLMGYGCNAPYSGGSCPPPGNERFFQNANGSSEGDPHLSFNGARWNNMVSQPDLLNSNSFAGGFQISTQTTPPNGKGVSWNQSATLSLNNGATRISMNNEGQPAITSFGQPISIARGQTLQLGDGESVTYEQNGSLRVCASNGTGGRIDTTLAAEGRGVNVDVTAHNVDLGGALVNGYERRHDPDPVPIDFPRPTPILGPTPTPILGPTPTPILGPTPTPILGPTPGPILEPYPTPLQ
jgi:hypothetical protein